MTRKALNLKVDDLCLAIAEANGFDVSDKTGLALTYAMASIALDANLETLVRAGTGANRVRIPKTAEPTPVPPTVLRAAAEEELAA